MRFSFSWSISRQRSPIDARILTVPFQIETSRTYFKPQSHDLVDLSKITDKHTEYERCFVRPSISGITHRVCVDLLTSGTDSGNVLGLELGLALRALDADEMEQTADARLVALFCLVTYSTEEITSSTLMYHQIHEPTPIQKVSASRRRFQAPNGQQNQADFLAALPQSSKVDWIYRCAKRTKKNWIDAG